MSYEQACLLQRLIYKSKGIIEEAAVLMKTDAANRTMHYNRLKVHANRVFRYNRKLQLA